MCNIPRTLHLPCGHSYIHPFHHCPKHYLRLLAPVGARKASCPIQTTTTESPSFCDDCLRRKLAEVERERRVADAERAARHQISERQKEAKSLQEEGSSGSAREREGRILRAEWAREERERRQEFLERQAVELGLPGRKGWRSLRRTSTYGAPQAQVWQGEGET